MTSRAMRGLFLVVEINFLMWIGVAFGVWKSNADDLIKYMAIAGAIFSALLQHWAYYNLYKATNRGDKAIIGQ